jgi:hypothetical protein
MLSRYGKENYSQTAEFKERFEKTSYEKYGTSHPTKSQNIVKKIQKTKLRKYGAINHTQLPENRNRLKQWCEDNPGSNGASKSELELLAWIQSYYPSAHKIKQEGQELDILVPELNLGIEYNGLFWHNELNKPRNYHLNKTVYFKSKNIRVIHIFEHEWLNRQEQIKSFLLSAMNKNEHKIGARKCKFIWSSLKEDIKLVQKFMDDYHIQGATSGVRYVTKVLLDNELIGCATFGKHHRNSTEWVLSRFCTKTNYTIQGALAKISKLAFSNLQSDIVSWADYRLSFGNGYLKAGWIQEELLRPDYFYHKGLQVISKQSRQKKSVGTPEGMTEHEHAKLDGLSRIYDCGKIRFKYNGTKTNPTTQS